MPDCYDTRSFSQSLIDAILEIWDTAGCDGRECPLPSATRREDPGTPGPRARAREDVLPRVWHDAARSKERCA
jgi:hypothetical protein